MRNQDKWKPSKFVHRAGRLRASTNPRELDVSSRLITDLVAALYDDGLRRHARGRLLDLGCGKVPLYAAYVPYVDSIECVDWGGTPHTTEYLDLEHDLNLPLPFGDNAFDTLILSDVLEHIANPDALFKEMARVLAPDGKILMNVPFYYQIHEQPHDYYRYTEFALMRFIEIASLKLVAIEVVGGAPEILADITSKFLAQVPLAGRQLSAFVQAATRFLVTSRWGRSFSQRSGKIFPMGYFVVATKP